MHEFCPEGFQRRHPKATKIHRVPLTSLGPNDEWSGDGHDKLCKIGMAIYGIRDKASGMWLGLWVVPNNRLNVVVAYLYLSLVEELGGDTTLPESSYAMSYLPQVSHCRVLRIVDQKRQLNMHLPTCCGTDPILIDLTYSCSNCIALSASSIIRK